MDLKEALQYLVSLKETKTFDIKGLTYADRDLHRIDPPRYYRDTCTFGSLDGIVKMVQAERDDYIENVGVPIFIRVRDHLSVEVFTRCDDKERRLVPYRATCSDASFCEGYRSQQEAIIELKSRFLFTQDCDYLLNLIARINNEQGVQSSDNGVTQTVTSTKGVSLMQTEAVKPRLSLKPFRTFREVPQPESEFILRLNEDGDVGLFEADGGIWKMEAKDNIKAYLENALHDEVEAGYVVVMV